MKKYLEPKIKAIKLDIEQAILNVCVIGGAYFNSTATLCVGTNASTVHATAKFCRSEPRGSGVGPCIRSWSSANEPS